MAGVSDYQQAQDKLEHINQVARRVFDAIQKTGYLPYIDAASEQGQQLGRDIASLTRTAMRVTEALMPEPGGDREYYRQHNQEVLRWGIEWTACAHQAACFHKNGVYAGEAKGSPRFENVEDLQARALDNYRTLLGTEAHVLGIHSALMRADRDANSAEAAGDKTRRAAAIEWIQRRLSQADERTIRRFADAGDRFRSADVTAVIPKIEPVKPGNRFGQPAAKPQPV